MYLCNPELPRIWQVGCVPAEQGSGKVPEPTKCNPVVPRYALRGCGE